MTFFEEAAAQPLSSSSHYPYSFAVHSISVWGPGKEKRDGIRASRLSSLDPRAKRVRELRDQIQLETQRFQIYASQPSSPYEVYLKVCSHVHGMFSDFEFDVHCLGYFVPILVLTGFAVGNHTPAVMPDQG